MSVVVGRQDSEVPIVLDGVPRIILGDHHLVELLTRTDADDLPLAAWSDRFGQIHDVHAGNLGHENLATVHQFKAPDDKLDSFLQRDPKSSHPRVGDRDLSVSTLL